MTHARIPDFSQPVPVRSTTAARSARRRTPADARYLNLPNEPIPGEIEPWQAVEPYRPDTATVRALRVMDIAGELLAAIAIIGGGIVLTGLASLL
ncbi:hypothetical protein MKK75_11035 [Methylobacterium sp. J-030]|uniref:hypothetical protein n=1 Tax=Methylobacterium sp. J-030 TaxID=2836627 RepID=UPI001FBBC126|nr:hypothetical protein [Methylobacterium sp. J-030]MCJ2069328.1 hypothetical protein [Methylobacterium sp. J-030]